MNTSIRLSLLTLTMSSATALARFNPGNPPGGLEPLKK